MFKIKKEKQFAEELISFNIKQDNITIYYLHNISGSRYVCSLNEDRHLALKKSARRVWDSGSVINHFKRGTWIKI